MHIHKLCQGQAAEHVRPSCTCPIYSVMMPVGDINLWSMYMLAALLPSSPSQPEQTPLKPASPPHFTMALAK